MQLLHIFGLTLQRLNGNYLSVTVTIIGVAWKITMSNLLHLVERWEIVKVFRTLAATAKQVFITVLCSSSPWSAVLN